MGYEPIKVIASAASADGHVNRITEFDDVPQSNKLSYRDGFPILTATPNEQNTRGPRRVDLNGLFYLFSSFLFELQQGNFPTYNSAIVGAGKPLPDGYPLGAVLWYPTGGYFVRSLVANNTESNLEDTSKWERIGGTSKAMGEVFYSQSADAEDNPGALPLFTGETISNADQLYPDFYGWVNAHSELQISAADYATAISTYGECPKYVIDTTNKTIRLPLLKTFIKMAQLGPGEDIKQGEAGLPNIEGSFCGGRNTVSSTGAFKTKGMVAGGFTNLDPQCTEYEFDASESNSTYGNSDTVTPQYTTLFPWVFAFNVTVPASVAQAAQFQAALSSKADTSLANIVSSAAANLNTAGIRTVTETYVNGTSWYRVWSDGWCEQGGYVSSIPGSGGITINFLVPMVDAKYSVFGGTVSRENAANDSRFECYARTTTSMVIDWSNSGHDDPTWWEVKGYIGQED